MNKERRKKINNIVSQLDKIIDQASDQLRNLNVVTDMEQDAFDNLPEGFQNSDRGAEMEDNVETLNDAHDKLYDAIDLLIDAMNILDSNFF